MANKKSTKKSSGTVGTATVKSKSESDVSTLASDVSTLAAYSQKTWVNGETIYDTDLNHMEKGIADAQDTADSAQSTADSAQSTAQSVEESALTGINVNGTAASVSNHVADIEVGAGGSYIGECFSVREKTDKNVECNGFALSEGATIMVLFYMGNTVEHPTLNVNGTGSYPVEGDIIGEGETYILFVYGLGGYWVDSVRGTARSAQATADEAVKSISSMEDKVDEAVDSASEAKTTANSASKTANEALETANEAQSVAKSASTVADEAEAIAANMQSTVDEAKNTADEAIDLARGVSDTAEVAQQAATNAQSTASAAQTTANEALNTVGTAQSAADNAQYTANEAKTVAQNALDSIPTNVSALNNDVPYVREDEVDGILADTVTGVTVNGAEQEVINHVAEINISGLGGGIYWAYCTNAATDTTKILSCAGIESYYNGLTIAVFFIHGAIAKGPKLNINSLGDVSICTSMEEGGSTSVYWGNETSILFSYYRDVFVPISSNNSGYTTCETEADEQEKRVEIINLIILNGTRITVCFTNGNTAKSPTLYFDSFIDAFEVEGNTNWDAGDYVDFVFDGEKWISLYK